MRSPKDFFRPLAVGAPDPVREVPFRPSRMIHFFDPSNPKMAAKVPDIAAKVDIILGNLEDAIKADNKEAAREGLVTIAEATDFGDTQLWTRVNSLDSPWVLDDLTRLVTAIGDKLDVIMIPKVEGPEDIHYVDRLVAQLEAKAGVRKPKGGDFPGSAISPLSSTTGLLIVYTVGIANTLGRANTRFARSREISSVKVEMDKSPLDASAVRDNEVRLRATEDALNLSREELKRRLNELQLAEFAAVEHREEAIELMQDPMEAKQNTGFGFIEGPARGM